MWLILAPFLLHLSPIFVSVGFRLLGETCFVFPSLFLAVLSQSSLASPAPWKTEVLEMVGFCLEILPLLIIYSLPKNLKNHIHSATI